MMECLAAGLAAAVVPLLSRAAVVRLARFCGRAAFLFARRERRIALANLDAAFGGRYGTDEKRQMVIDSLASFSLVLLDIFWFGRSGRAKVDRWVKRDPSIEEAFARKGPTIFLTGHFGNWEVLGLLVAVRCGRLLSVAAPVENRIVDLMLNRRRMVTGQTIVPKEGAVRPLIRELKRGGRAALVMDQNTLPRDGGVFVKMFGLPVPVSMAAASLHLHTKSDIVMTWCVPDNSGCYTAYALPPCRYDGPVEGAEGRITAAIAGMYEDVIKKHPAMWLWSYKRWKFIPADMAREGFPFYSRRMTDIEMQTGSAGMQTQDNSKEEQGR